MLLIFSNYLRADVIILSTTSGVSDVINTAKEDSIKRNLQSIDQNSNRTNSLAAV